MDYKKSLQKAAFSKDLDKFMSVYVQARENRSGLGDEAAYLLSEMGTKAVEKVAIMLNNENIKEDFRGHVANCLLRAISLKPKIGNSDRTKEELVKSVDSALTNTEFFISSNAKEALLKCGVKEISGVPIEDYERNLRDKKLKEDMNKLLSGGF